MLNDIMEIYIKNANVKRGAKKNMDSIESKLINEIKEAFPNNNLINYEFTNDDVLGLIFENNLTVDDIIILSDSFSLELFKMMPDYNQQVSYFKIKGVI